MRIDRLRLKFGPFAEAELDCSGGAEGLHLVFGRNEAGKSSLLRALEAFFFGVPKDTADDWKHGGPNVRIEAWLRRRDGAELRAVRRKGNKNTLLDAAGATIDEDVLRTFSGGVEQADFRSFFGLNLDQLRRGGQEVAGGGGELGKLLFAARAGLTNLDATLKSLRADADRLFLKTGRNPAVNNALALAKAEADAAASETLAPETWTEAQRRSAESAARRQERAAVRTEWATELERTKNLAAAVPVARALDHQRAEAAALADAPDLTADSTADFRKALAEHARHEPLLADARRQRAAKETELGELRHDAALLAARAGLERLAERLGNDKKATADRPGIQARVNNREHDLRELLRQLGRPADLATVDACRIPEPATAAVRELSQEARAVEQAAEAAAGAARRAQAAFEEPREKTPAALAPDGPGRNAADAARRRHEQSEVDLRDAAKELRAAEAHLSKAVRQRAALSADSVPPTVAELQSVRAERDAAFAAFRQQPEPAKGDDVAARIAAADALADALRRDAARVAEFAAVEHTVAEATAAREAASQTLATLQAERAAADAEWQTLWTGAGHPQRSPAEALDWLAARATEEQKIARAREQLAQAKDQSVAAAERLARHRSEWQAALAAAGLPGASSVAAATKALELAGKLAEKLNERSVDLARLKGIDRVAAEFRTDLAEFARRHAPDLASTAEPADLVAELQRRLQAAQTVADQRDQLAKQIKADQRRLDALAEELDRLQGQLTQFQGLAGVPEGGSLAEALDRADRKREALRACAQAEEQLRRLADRRPAAEFAAAAAAAEPAELTARQHGLEAQLRPLDAEIDDLLREQTLAEAEVRKLETAGAAAAERHQRAQELLAAARGHARQYAVLRAAELLLRRGAERQRAQAEGRLLERASAFLATLSAGAFAGLEPGRDDHGGETLFALRAGGERVPPRALSEGASDQFFLALRLAGLEERLETPDREPFPLFVDDLLSSYDDERAAAALRALGALSAKTQVLFLTHHAHLVELARRSVPPDRLFLHDLHEAAAFAAAAPNAPPRKSAPRRKLAATADAGELFAEQ